MIEAGELEKLDVIINYTAEMDMVCNGKANRNNYSMAQWQENR